jgi:hypothetical protein
MKTAKPRYTVRKQTSGWSGTVRYYVWDRVKKSRVTVHADLHRDVAQMHADSLNVMDMVKPHAEDPRPYEVRLAEAEAAFRASQGKPLIEIL